MNNFIKAKQSASIRINQKIHELKKKGKKTTILSLGEAFFKLPDFGIKKVFSDLTYYQIDDPDFYHTNPKHGTRIAIFCDNDWEKVARARNIAIALFSPDIDGKYSRALYSVRGMVLVVASAPWRLPHSFRKLSARRVQWCRLRAPWREQ